MRFAAIPGTAIALLLLCAVAVPAQSLADLARQEQERRKAVKASGKVYTNDSLGSTAPPAVTTPAAPPTVAAPAPPPAAASPQAPPGSQVPAGEAPAAGVVPKTEAEWRKRIAAERDALARAELFAESLQSSINALSTDYVNRDDPAQRDVVAAKRQKALAELDRVKQEIQQHQKAIAGIQDEARRAGVPAGWVR